MTWRPGPFLLMLLVVVALAAWGPLPAWAARGGELTLRIIDGDTKQPIAARMHLKTARGRVVQPPGAAFFKDHFAIDGEIKLKLARGGYVFELDRGKEYRDYTGHFEITDDATDVKVVEMNRYIDLAKAGWYSGDLHVHRPVEQIELLMRADDLHVAPVITWWRTSTRWQPPPATTRGLVAFDNNRFYHGLAGEDERDGGALLLLNLTEALDLSTAEKQFPSSVEILQQARQQTGVHVDAEKPFWWDFPLWLACGRVDSIGLVNNHLWRDGVLDNEAWGKPRDRVLFPAPHGNGRWSEAIYYHALGAGFRIPPSAGSASGVLPNPVGYNRVYVHCGDEFDYAAWWRNLRQGRVFVTNGPLLQVSVEGHPPGHVFDAQAGEMVELEIALTLSTREPIEYLEIVKDGRPLHTVRLDQFRDAKGRLPKVPFDQSGWFLVRAVTNNPKTYRYASTGPYYVDFDYQRRISRGSAQFFLDWVEEGMKRIDITDAEKRQAVLSFHEQARKFWSEMVEKATAP